MDAFGSGTLRPPARAEAVLGHAVIDTDAQLVDLYR
jgi:hypothetical protein